MLQVRSSATVNSTEPPFAELIDSVAHGLAQPLTVINLSVAAIEQRLQSLDDGASAEQIRLATGNVQELCEDLFVVLQLLNGEHEPRRSPITWPALFRQALEPLGIEAQCLRVTGAEDWTGLHEPGLLARLIRNLVRFFDSQQPGSPQAVGILLERDGLTVTAPRTTRVVAEPGPGAAGPEMAWPRNAHLAIARKLAGLLGQQLTLRSETGRITAFRLNPARD